MFRVPEMALFSIWSFYDFQAERLNPKFFVFTDNPGALPLEFISFKTRTSFSHYYRLDLTEMNELNVPYDPCNPEPNYNFQMCLKKSVSEQVLYNVAEIRIFYS